MVILWEMDSNYRHNPPSNPSITAIRASRGKLGPEDTLTNLVAYALAENPDIAYSWAMFLLSHVESQGEMFDDIPVEVSVHPYSGKVQPDMTMTLGNRARIVFEHKLDSPEGFDQVQRYLDFCAGESRRTGIPHFLAFVAPSPHNLVGSHYKCDQFVTMDGRHPLWADLGGIIEGCVEENPGIRGLYELFDYMNLLPFEMPETLEPLLRVAGTIEELGADAVKARRWFYYTVREAGKDAIERGWTVGASGVLGCFFEPPDRVREQHPQLRWLVFEAWPRPRTIGGVRMPAPSIFVNITDSETRENDASRNIEGLIQRFRGREIGGYTPKVSYSREPGGKRSTRVFWMFFDLNKIWEKGDLEFFMKVLVSEMLNLFDPPVEGE